MEPETINPERNKATANATIEMSGMFTVYATAYDDGSMVAQYVFPESDEKFGCDIKAGTLKRMTDFMHHLGLVVMMVENHKL